MHCQLPDLHTSWPFPKILNPLYSEVAPESLKWINSYRLFNGNQQRKFKGIKAGLLGSFAYPVHERVHLRLACDLMNVLFAVDEISDVLDGHEAEELAAKILQCFRDPSSETPRNEGEHPLIRLHQDFLRSVVKATSSSNSLRFLKDYEYYLKAMVKEAKDRETRSIRTTIEGYLELRRYTGAIKPSFDMILMPLDIPEVVLEEPKIKELEAMAIEMVAVANDVVSFNVEQARGDIHNLVIVLVNAEGIPAQEAMERVGKWYQKRAQDFIKAMADLPIVESKKLRVDIQRYVWGLGNSTRR